MSTMQALPVVNKISFKNILFLTDFTEASQNAMAYALGLENILARKFIPPMPVIPSSLPKRQRQTFWTKWKKTAVAA